MLFLNIQNIYYLAQVFIKKEENILRLNFNENKSFLKGVF